MNYCCCCCCCCRYGATIYNDKSLTVEWRVPYHNFLPTLQVPQEDVAVWLHHALSDSDNKCTELLRCLQPGRCCVRHRHRPAESHTAAGARCVQGEQQSLMHARTLHRALVLAVESNLPCLMQHVYASASRGCVCHHVITVVSVVLTHKRIHTVAMSTCACCTAVRVRGLAGA
jgi:hypothetical protein